MPNASNTERVVAAIGGEDVTASRAIIAVQGPAAREHLATIAPEAAAIGRFRVGRRRRWPARECTVAGTGYTGEDGVELAVPADAAPAVWEALLATGLLPGRARRPRHPAPRGGAAAARPRARARASPRSRPASAGWWRGTRTAASAGRDALARRAGAGRGPSPARPRRRGPAPAAGRAGRCSSTARRPAWSPAATSRRSSGHGIALGVPAPGGRGGRRGGHRRARRGRAGAGRPDAVRGQGVACAPADRRGGRMRRITMLALVAVLALTGAACGGDDDDAGGDGHRGHRRRRRPPTTAATTAVTTAAPPTAARRRGLRSSCSRGAFLNPLAVGAAR